EVLAQGLCSSSNTTMDVQAWKAANAALACAPVIARLDRYIGEAAVHLGPAEAADRDKRLFHVRSRGLRRADEPDWSRRVHRRHGGPDRIGTGPGRAGPAAKWAGRY